MTTLDLTGLYIVGGILLVVFLCCVLWLIIAGASRSAHRQPAPPRTPPTGGAGESGAYVASSRERAMDAAWGYRAQTRSLADRWNAEHWFNAGWNAHAAEPTPPPTGGDGDGAGS